MTSTIARRGFLLSALLLPGALRATKTPLPPKRTINYPPIKTPRVPVLPVRVGGTTYYIRVYED
jgi:hypothetical protein